MPNRIIKESICTSESIDMLSSFQEVFFYRLIVSCDDYGRYDARPKVLASRLFPLKDIRISQVEDALRALISAELVTLYTVDGKPFLQIVNWKRHQQPPRAKKSRFPAPYSESNLSDSNCAHMQSDDNNCAQLTANAPDTRYSILDTRYSIHDSEQTTENPSATRIDYQQIINMYHEVCVSLPKVKTLTDSRKKAIKARLHDIGESMEELRRVFESVEQSDFLTGRVKDFTASFDWIFKPSNFVKIREGNYENKGGGRNGDDGHSDGQAGTDWGFADDGSVV